MGALSTNIVRTQDFDLSQRVLESSANAAIAADTKGFGVSQQRHDQQMLIAQVPANIYPGLSFCTRSRTTES